MNKKCYRCDARSGERHKRGCPDEYQALPSFRTKAELNKYLAEHTPLEQTSSGIWYYPGTYYLSHGEYERPDYIPTRYKDGWGLKVRYFFFRGTLYAPDDGRVEEVEVLV